MREFTYRVDQRVYRLAAIKKAAYKFAGKFDILISVETDDQVLIQFRAKPALTSAADAIQSFETELLDQELREVVAEETAGVRNLLLAQAFSATSLLDPVGESGDPDADPLGIRTPDHDVMDP